MAFKWDFDLINQSNVDQQSLKILTRISPAAQKVLQNLAKQQASLNLEVQINSESISSVIATVEDKMQALLAEAEKYGLQIRLEILADGFEIRKVAYEKLHAVASEDMRCLVDCLELKNGANVLDMMCGYGAVGEYILEYARSNQQDIKLGFCDLHEKQLAHMQQKIRAQATEIKIGDARQAPFPSDYFDAIVIKMGTHDVPKFDQPLIFQEAFRMLKRNGIFAIWDVMFDDAETQDVFAAIIRKKDELAGYESFICDRYFFREDQAHQLFIDGGFSQVEKVREVSFRQSTLKRCDSELGGSEEKVAELNNFIRRIVSAKLKSRIHYVDNGSDILFSVPNRILKGRKILK